MDQPDRDLDRALRRQEASDAVSGLGWRYVLGLLRASLPAAPDGSIGLVARAWAVRGVR